MGMVWPAQALELAREFDPSEERTLRVLTKYDMFDSDESRDRANEIISQVNQLSPHAIVCRPDGKDYVQEDEETFFSNLNRNLLKNINKKVFSINEIWNELIEKNNLFGFDSNNKFYHVTDLEIYNKLLKSY